MAKINSGYYGLLFVVLLSGQLTRESHGRIAIEIIATTAISLLIGFVLMLPFCFLKNKKPNTMAGIIIAVVLSMGIALTVIDIFNYYNLTSQERTAFLPIAVILFGVSFYSGLLNSNAVKTAGLFISFLLSTVLILIGLFNLPQLSITNIDLSFDRSNVIVFDDLLSVAVLIPSFAILSSNELKVGKMGLLMLLVLVVVAIFSLLAEAVLGNNLSFFAVPINALAIVGELSIFRRLDIVLGTFIFLAGCMKISTLSNSMAYILNQKRFYIAVIATFIGTVIINEISVAFLPIFVGASAMFVCLILLVPYKQIIKLTVLLPVVFLVGCGGVELQERAAVTMTFVDKEDEYKVSLLVCTEYEENGPSVSLISGSGETFSSALYNVAKEVNGELYMGQSELIILGKGFLDGGIGELLPQLYETKMTDGNAFIYLSEYTEEELIEKEGKLLDATGSVLRQSESNRLPIMQIYNIAINENGKLNGIMPIVDVFEYKGAVATAAILYKDGIAVTKIDREQLELIYALKGDRNRIAVVYDYNNSEMVSGISEITTKLDYKNNQLIIKLECVADGQLSQDELEAIRKSLTDKIVEIINIISGSGVDALSFEKQFNIELSDIKETDVTIRFKT